MTTNEPRREVGYRGALPIREDRLARPWIFTVIGIFALVLVLSIAGIPSRFIPDPTPIPVPSAAPVSPSDEATDEASPSASQSDEASESASPSPSATP